MQLNQSLQTTQSLTFDEELINNKKQENIIIQDYITNFFNDTNLNQNETLTNKNTTVSFEYNESLNKSIGKISFGEYNILIGLISNQVILSMSPTDKIKGSSAVTFSYKQKKDFLITLGEKLTTAIPTRPNLLNEATEVFDFLSNPSKTKYYNDKNAIVSYYNKEKAICKIAEQSITVFYLKNGGANIEINGNPVEKISFTNEDDFNINLGVLLDQQIPGRTRKIPNIGKNIYNNLNLKTSTEIISATTKIKTKTDFVNFLNTPEIANLGDYPNTNHLGRYLRVMRYSNTLEKYKESIPIKYLFALAMVESQGDPTSANFNDGGAGFFHTQPDVATSFGLSVFTDKTDTFYQQEGFKSYTKYKYSTMKANGTSRAEIYKIHGEKLKFLKSSKGLNNVPEKLEKRDDRFNIDKNIETTVSYLESIKTNYVDTHYATRIKNQDTRKDTRNKYTETELKWLLTLNGFNKGPNNFSREFQAGTNYPKRKDGKIIIPRSIATADNSSHITHITNSLTAYEKYETALPALFNQGKTGPAILEELKKL